MSPSITVHHLEKSRSQRIVWLLEELGLPYEFKLYKRTPAFRAPPELFAIHPSGKSPVITDGDVTVVESGAVVEYLIEKYGGGKYKPKTAQGILDNRYYTHYAEGTYGPPLVMREVLGFIGGMFEEDIRLIVQAQLAKVDEGFISPDIALHSKLIEAQLAKGNEWLAGGEEPTSADFMLAFTLLVAADRAGEFTGPKTKEYLWRIQDRPAYKRALERIGDSAYLLPLQ